MQRWCSDRGATLPFFSVRPPRGAHAGIVRCHLRHVYGLRTYNFSNLYNFPLNKIIEAAEPVNPYENLTAASCLRTEASRRPHGKGDTGSVDPLQAKCELGINNLHLQAIWKEELSTRLNHKHRSSKHQIYGELDIARDHGWLPILQVT